MKFSLNKRLMTTALLRFFRGLFVFIDYTARLVGYSIIYILIMMSIDGDLNLNFNNEDDGVYINFTASNTGNIGETNGTKD